MSGRVFCFLKIKRRPKLKVKLILIRHGESIANKYGIYQGQSYDIGLTPKGKCQAELVAKRLKDFNIQAIYTSPLQRARETAEIIATEYKLSIIVDKNLIEISHGKWEGETIEWVRKNYLRLYKIWKTKPEEVRIPDGENCGQVMRRVERFLQSLTVRKGTVLVVTHDFVLRLILAKILGLPINNIWRIKLDNGAINIVELGQKERVTLLNDMAHLKVHRVNVDKQAL